MTFKVQAFGNKEAQLLVEIGEALGYVFQGTTAGDPWELWFHIPDNDPIGAA